MDDLPGPWKEHKALEDQNHEDGCPNPGPPVDHSKRIPWALFVVIFILMALATCKGG